MYNYLLSAAASSVYLASNESQENSSFIELIL
jgi:hypothetical protein